MNHNTEHQPLGNNNNNNDNTMRLQNTLTTQATDKPLTTTMTIAPAVDPLVLYPCSSCYTLHDRSTVQEVDARKYEPREEWVVVFLRRCVEGMRGRRAGNGDNKTWICNACHRQLKKSMVPMDSWVKGLLPATLPTRNPR